MSKVLPQFDSSTRTLKIRLEADNPGYALRPDMFVNVEIPVRGTAAIVVPTDAVVDSGLKKTVFVDRGNGYFEPRQVETGRSMGEQVEISKGLMAGEKIVVSGNFLIDSEARMQRAAAGLNGKAGRDPVCGMNIDEGRSRAAGYVNEYQGKSYFFCSPECRNEFVKAPKRYLSSAAGPNNMPASVTRQDTGARQDAGADHASHGIVNKRRRGADPSESAVLPGAQENPSMIMPKTSGSMSLEAGPDMKNRQKKPIGNGQDHD